MHILANENFPLDAVEALRAAGHDVTWMRTEAPGSSDESILRRAQTENRIFVTFDKDLANWFTEWACLLQAELSYSEYQCNLPHM